MFDDTGYFNDQGLFFSLHDVSWAFFWSIREDVIILGYRPDP